MPKVNEFLTVDMSQLLRNLDQVSKRVAQNIVRRGLLAGGGVIRDAARNNAPVLTGALKKSIIAQTNRRKSNRTISVVTVKIDSKAYTPKSNGKGIKAVARSVQKARGKKYSKGEIYPRNYAHLVEYGTKAHHIGKGSKALGVTKSGKVYGGYGRGTMHPGAKPKPFMRPAFDSKGDEAVAKVRQVIGRELVKEIQAVPKSQRRAS